MTPIRAKRLERVRAASGRVLLRLRKESRLSQGGLAMVAGLSQGQIGILENGLCGLTVDTLLRLAGPLGVSAPQIMAEICRELGQEPPQDSRPREIDAADRVAAP